MTTVGYGDYFPKTNMGRCVGAAIAIWGVFIVSLFVVTLQNLFEFDKLEMKSFELSYRL
jgi:potassium intermediate/small conductance calcium-activated channel subfamily N protein 2